MKKMLRIMIFLFILCSFTSEDYSYVYGRIKIVSSSEDYRVMIVNYNEDIEINTVEYSPSMGQWRFVKYNEDYRIKFVSYNPDFTIKLNR